MADCANPENGADKPAPTIPSLKKALLMRRLLGLGLAPLLVLAAVLAAPVLMPSLSFLAAVIVASFVGGFWPGFLATALGALALDFFFIEPIGTLRIDSSQEQLALAGFVVVGAVLSFLMDLFLRARWRARNARSIVARNADLLQRFVEHVPAPVAMLDRSLRYMVVSRRWLMDYQLAERDVIGKSHHDLFPLMPEHWKGVHQRCLAGAIEKADEEALTRPDGSVEWVTWEVRPWHDEHGEIGGICIYAESNTKRKEAEDALRRTTAELQRTFDVCPTGLVRCDKDMRFVSANAAYGAIAG